MHQRFITRGACEQHLGLPGAEAPDLIRLVVMPRELSALTAPYAMDILPGDLHYPRCRLV